jgi:hypothetical protein
MAVPQLGCNHARVMHLPRQGEMATRVPLLLDRAKLLTSMVQRLVGWCRFADALLEGLRYAQNRRRAHEGARSAPCSPSQSLLRSGEVVGVLVGKILFRLGRPVVVRVV